MAVVPNMTEAGSCRRAASVGERTGAEETDIVELGLGRRVGFESMGSSERDCELGTSRVSCGCTLRRKWKEGRRQI